MGDTPREESESLAAPKRIDPHETYNRINVKRQLTVAKAIIAQKKAVELAQKFDEEQDNYFKRKHLEARERERKLQDVRFRQLAHAEQMAAISNRMQAEERNQVTAMIRDSAARKGDHRRAETERSNRDTHLHEARVAFEQQRLSKHRAREAADVDALKQRILAKEEARAEMKKEREAGDAKPGAEAKKEEVQASTTKAPVDRSEQGSDEELYARASRFMRAQTSRSEHVGDVRKRLQEKNSAAGEVKKKKEEKLEKEHNKLFEECMRRMQKSNIEEKRADRKEAWLSAKQAEEERLIEKLEAKEAKARPGNYALTADHDPHARYFKVSQELE